MEQGSELFNIVITVLFIVVIFIIIYAIYILNRKSWLRHELHRVRTFSVFQITLPKQVAQRNDKEPPKDFREMISVADQFFASLNHLSDKSLSKQFYGVQNHLSFEIIAADGKLEFFCICPKEIEAIVERQIHSYWPTSQINKARLPNIFKSRRGAMASCNFALVKRFILPIKTYKNLESDPLNALTNALTKLPVGSGAAIQMLVRPSSDNWKLKVDMAAKNVKEGRSVYSTTMGAKASSLIFDLFSGIFHGQDKSKAVSGSNEYLKLTPIQEQTLKLLHEKQAKPGMQTIIRVVTCAPSRGEAEIELKNITTAFAQFSSPEANGFKVRAGNGETIRDYILRRFSGKRMLLNAEELSSVYHLPSHYTATPNISWAMAQEMPPPTNLPQEGTVLGESVYRGQTRPVMVKDDDRRRHVFMIGKTGVGKTTLFTNMIEQDMKAGRGCCFIDPLGDAIEDLLGKVPQDRIKDVVLFDPSDTEFPMGLNLLEWQTKDQRDFLIQEAIQIFYKLFDPGQTGIVGPQWEHWFRNAALTVMGQPGGGTLIDIPRIFTDDAFRMRLISFVEDPIVKAFWTQQLAKTADFHKSEMYNYFISKFGRFTTNELMRNIIGQKQSSFDFRKIMDEGKIFLVNLSKGKIGEVNSTLLGMILVSKIQMSAFSRADIPEDTRRDFYLYVDEFQNFTTDSFATILSEARKYRLNLNITNQYIAQLTEKIRDAVVGNVGTMIAYRIGAADAEFIVKEFPGITAEDMTNLDKFNTYTKLLIDGTPSKPFSMKGIKSETASVPEIRESARNFSRQSYAKSRTEVEGQIRENIQALGKVSASSSPSPSELPKTS